MNPFLSNRCFLLPSLAFSNDHQEQAAQKFWVVLRSVLQRHPQYQPENQKQINGNLGQKRENIWFRHLFTKNLKRSKIINSCSRNYLIRYKRQLQAICKFSTHISFLIYHHEGQCQMSIASEVQSILQKDCTLERFEFSSCISPKNTYNLGQNRIYMLII